MGGSEVLRRWMLRGLALVAALVAVSAFHSSASEPVDSPLVVAQVVAPAASDLVGPLHVDLSEVPSAVPDEDHHTHLFVVFMLGGLLLAFVARPSVAYAIGDLWRLPGRLLVTDPPWATAPSLNRLCVLRT
ncbi:hypothetical protein ACWGID_07450 [Kribbella sp. NPDC054772]